jgi:hypothetical protein
MDVRLTFLNALSVGFLLMGYLLAYQDDKNWFSFILLGILLAIPNLLR